MSQYPEPRVFYYDNGRYRLKEDYDEYPRHGDFVVDTDSKTGKKYYKIFNYWDTNSYIKLDSLDSGLLDKSFTLFDKVLWKNHGINVKFNHKTMNLTFDHDEFIISINTKNDNIPVVYEINSKPYYQMLHRYGFYKDIVTEYLKNGGNFYINFKGYISETNTYKYTAYNTDDNYREFIQNSQKTDLIKCPNCEIIFKK